MPLQIKIKSPEGGTLKTANTYIEDDVNIIPNLQDLTITKNGTYVPDEGYAGLSKIIVNMNEAGTIPIYDGAVSGGIVPAKLGQYGVRLSNIWFGEEPPEDNTKLWAETDVVNLREETIVNDLSSYSIEKQYNVSEYEFNGKSLEYSSAFSIKRKYEDVETVLYESNQVLYIKSVTLLKNNGVYLLVELGSSDQCIVIRDYINGFGVFGPYTINNLNELYVASTIPNSSGFAVSTDMGTYLLDFNNGVEKINSNSNILFVKDLNISIELKDNNLYLNGGVIVKFNNISYSNLMVGTKGNIYLDDSTYTVTINFGGGGDIEGAIPPSKLTIYTDKLPTFEWHPVKNVLSNISNINNEWGYTSGGLLPKEIYYNPTFIEGTYLLNGYRYLGIYEDNIFNTGMDDIYLTYPQLYINGIRIPFRKYNPDTGVWERLDNFFGEE